MQNRIADPFKAGPRPDPAPDLDGLIRPAPHCHVRPLPEVFDTIQQALAESRAGNSVLLMSAWMHLTPACFTGGQLALIQRALIELSSRIKSRMGEFLDIGRPVCLPQWTHDLYHRCNGDVSHEEIERAFLDDYRAFAIRYIAEEPTDTHRSAVQSLLGTALVSAYLDTDDTNAEALLANHDQPDQVMLALNLIFIAIVNVISEVEQIPFEDAARSFDSSHLV